MRRMWMAVAAVGVLVGVGWGVVGGQEEGVGLVEAGVGRLVVGWEWEGAEVERFLVSWRERAGALWTVREVAGTARRFEISGLRSGTAYVVRVRGLDARGRGVASGGRTSDLRGAFETLRREGPSGLRIDQRWFGGTGATFRIAWDAPAEAWGWSGWLVRWRELGAADTAWRSGSPAAAARSTLVGGLKENSAYLVRVAALDGSAESEAAELRFTAARPLGKAAITSATWDGSTITAAWRAERAPAVYDVRFSIVEDDPAAADQPVLTYSIALETAETTASQGVPRQRPHRVQVRARIGSGEAAAVGEWSEPALVVLLPAPAAPAVSFDGERATATWDAVEGATGYELVWGAAGAAAAERLGADERSFTTGVLTAGTRYQFRLRVLNASGRSDLSSTASLTPTAWPNAVPAATFKFYEAAGMLVEWTPVEGVDDYVVGWTKRGDASRSGATAATGSSLLATRDGGFFSGVWLLRVRVAGTGMWSDARSIWVQSPAPELRFWLESSRTLCTEGTLTEIRWRGGGGGGNLWPHINGRMIGEATYRVKVNCGMIPRTADGELDQTQLDAVITGHLLDGRGTIKSASIRIPRAPALPAPTDFPGIAPYPDGFFVSWWADDGSPSPSLLGTISHYAVRWRRSDSTEWNYRLTTHLHRPKWPASAQVLGLPNGVSHDLSVAALRAPIEFETPDALAWAPTMQTNTPTAPRNVRAVATHDQITVSWDSQPSVTDYRVVVEGPLTASGRVRTSKIYPITPDRQHHLLDRHSVTFKHLPPDTTYTVAVRMENVQPEEPSLKTFLEVRTSAAPASWTPPARGPQNVRTTVTATSITVTWDPPYPDASPRYFIELIHPDYPWTWYRFIDATSYTFDGIWPDVTYSLVIEHLGVIRREVSMDIRTESSAVGGADDTEPPEAGGFPEPGWIRGLPAFAWPVEFGADWKMTTDMWVPRNKRYHAGLDIASDRPGQGLPHAGPASAGCLGPHAGVSGGAA